MSAVIRRGELPEHLAHFESLFRVPPPRDGSGGSGLFGRNADGAAAEARPSEAPLRESWQTVWRPAERGSGEFSPMRRSAAAGLEGDDEVRLEDDAAEYSTPIMNAVLVVADRMRADDDEGPPPLQRTRSLSPEAQPRGVRRSKSFSRIKKSFRGLFAAAEAEEEAPPPPAQAAPISARATTAAQPTRPLIRRAGREARRRQAAQPWAEALLKHAAIKQMWVPRRAADPRVILPQLASSMPRDAHKADDRARAALVGVIGYDEDDEMAAEEERERNRQAALEVKRRAEMVKKKEAVEAELKQHQDARVRLGIERAVAAPIHSESFPPSNTERPPTDRYPFPDRYAPAPSAMGLPPLPPPSQRPAPPAPVAYPPVSRTAARSRSASPASDGRRSPAAEPKAVKAERTSPTASPKARPAAAPAAPPPPAPAPPPASRPAAPAPAAPAPAAPAPPGGRATPPGPARTPPSPPLGPAPATAPSPPPPTAALPPPAPRPLSRPQSRATLPPEEPLFEYPPWVLPPPIDVDAYRRPHPAMLAPLPPLPPRVRIRPILPPQLSGLVARGTLSEESAYAQQAITIFRGMVGPASPRGVPIDGFAIKRLVVPREASLAAREFELEIFAPAPRFVFPDRFAACFMSPWSLGNPSPSPSSPPAAQEPAPAPAPPQPPLRTFAETLRPHPKTRRLSGAPIKPSTASARGPAHAFGPGYGIGVRAFSTPRPQPTAPPGFEPGFDLRPASAATVTSVSFPAVRRARRHSDAMLEAAPGPSPAPLPPRAPPPLAARAEAWLAQRQTLRPFSRPAGAIGGL